MNSMYVQSGLFNIVLVLIVWNKVFRERNQFRDCKLFSCLLMAVFCVIIMDTVGWVLDGKLLGELRMITNVVDGFNLIATAAVCWCWVQYVQYLAFEDAGIPGHKNYFSSVLFGIHAFVILAAIPTKLFYYIDEAGCYCRSTGYSLTVIACLVQLIYAITCCLITRRQVQSKPKREELLQIGLIYFITNHCNGGSGLYLWHLRYLELHDDCSDYRLYSYSG